jgi:putative ABC transport system permease protein
MMIRKSIKIALQRLQIYKAYSAINIIGLAIAMSVCIAILSFAQYHFGFDNHIKDVGNAYRMISRYGEGTYNTNTFAAFDDVLDNYPQIASYTTCYNNHNIEEAFVDENRVLFNDAFFIEDSFLDYFSVNVISGDRMSINMPNTMMVTPSLASRLFPESDPLGKTIQLRSFTRNQDSLITYTITGIVEPLPESTHLKYEALLSENGHFEPTLEILKTRKLFGALVYLKLYENVDVPELEKKLQTVLQPMIGAAHGPPLEVFNHKLQPLHEIHFTPGLSNEITPVVRRSSLYILLLVGLLIFAISIMNFVIMHIARSTSYYKTNLIIRFLGGKKQDIFTQTFVDVSISVGISFYVTIALLSGISLLLDNYFLNDWTIPFMTIEFWFILIVSFLIVVVLVTLLSSVSLINTPSTTGDNTRPGGIKAAIPLVVFQFVLVVALSGFTMQVNRQMNFIEKKDKGYESEKIITVKVSQSNEKIRILRQELLNETGIESVGTSQHPPGGKFQDLTFTNGDNSFPFIFGFADKYLLRTLGVKPVKYFTDEGEDATDGWIINETFYRKLRSVFNDEQIASGDFTGTNNSSADNNITEFRILGVVEDFHYASLHSEIASFAYFIRGEEAFRNRYLVIRYNPQQLTHVLNTISHKYQSIYPGHHANYAFLEETLEKRYRSEQILLKLINIFSMLAIVVACLGLIGLSIFIAEKRSKEIGIRKVNGAKTMEILMLLNKDILKWVCISIVIATPISWYLSQRWFEGFAYRCTNNWWIFLLAGVMAITVALITVSWQTIKSARKNPVESLRYE